MITLMKARIHRGFTLIELITVISIIGVLTSVVLFGISEARKNSQIKAETAQVGKIMLDMMLYRDLYGVFPPGTRINPIDICSQCYLNPGYQNLSEAKSKWNSVASRLTPNFTPNAIEVDTWGNPYGYDNNFLVPGDEYYTVLCSQGPDGIMQTSWPHNDYLLTMPNPQAKGDDICVFFK